MIAKIFDWILTIFGIGFSLFWFGLMAFGIIVGIILVIQWLVKMNK
jgi:hypothetical protein